MFRLSCITARSAFVALFLGALVAALIVVVPRLQSNAATIGAGIVCGGALGNLVSIFAWAQGVPDPLMIVTDTHVLAFNLADVFAVVGDVLLLSAAILHGLRQRARLRQRAELVVQVFEVVDDRRLLLPAAPDDFRDRSSTGTPTAMPRLVHASASHGEDECGHAETLPHRVVPQKPHELDGFLHLGSSFTARHRPPRAGPASLTRVMNRPPARL